MNEVRCPYCNSDSVKKEGMRRAKRGEVQKYRCLVCGKFFSCRGLKHKSYDARTILRSVSTHNLGYTLEQTVKEMSRRFHQKIPHSTVRSWIKEYADTCTYARLRDEARKLYPPDEIIYSQKLEHRQIYEFKLHRAKLELQAKELSEQKFQLLKAYLERVSTDDFPHHIFTVTDDSLE